MTIHTLTKLQCMIVIDSRVMGRDYMSVAELCKDLNLRKSESTLHNSTQSLHYRFHISSEGKKKVGPYD